MSCQKSDSKEKSDSEKTITDDDISNFARGTKIHTEGIGYV